MATLIARLMRPTWGPSGADRTRGGGGGGPFWPHELCYLGNNVTIYLGAERSHFSYTSRCIMCIFHTTENLKLGHYTINPPIGWSCSVCIYSISQDKIVLCTSAIGHAFIYLWALGWHTCIFATVTIVYRYMHSIPSSAFVHFVWVCNY